MKNMIKLGLVLAAYATAACVGLAFVYTGTSKVIEERQKADLETALTDLFPQSDSFEDLSGTIPDEDASVSFVNEYVIKKNGSTIGMAIRSVGSSYGGPITVLVGVGMDEKIKGVKILENKDTPGLGANAASPAYFVDKAAGLTFYGQFKGKNLKDPFTVKDDIAAITASTITSTAVTHIVKVSGRAAQEWLFQATGGSK